MALEDDITFFERVPTFSMLGKQALRILAMGAEARRLPSGTVLYYAGDLAEGAYIIQDGTLSIEPSIPATAREYRVGAGSLLCELALLTDMVCPGTATAIEPTTVIRISRSLFQKMLEGYPVAAKRLHDTMAQRVDSWTRELIRVKQSMDKNDL
jgi:CRP-like cAMP-binding protein